MHDAVADVLREREQLARTPRLAYAVSLALHAGIAAMLVLAPRLERDRELARPIAINMRLAPARSGVAGGGRAMQARPRPSPAAQRKAVEPKAPPQPEKKVPGKVDPVRTAEKSVFGKAPEPATGKKPAGGKGDAAAATQGRPAGPGGTGTDAFTVPGLGSAGVTGLEGGNFPYSMYIDRMTTKIGGNWFRPQSAGDMITVVYFVIERGGAIRDARIERSSGNRLFDRAAYRAVIESSPLPPLPMQYSGGHLGVHLTFH